MKVAQGRWFDELAAGDTFGSTVTITETHLVLGAGYVADFNPLHVDEAFARRSRFGGRILHGMLTSALMGGPVGMHFHGTAIAYLEHNARFLAPVRPGDTLTLASDPGGTLSFTRVPPPELDGTNWTITGFNNGRQAVVSPLGDTTLTLSFRDGRVSGFAGCNGFNGAYTRDGDRLSIGPLATTRKACTGMSPKPSAATETRQLKLHDSSSRRCAAVVVVRSRS